MDFRWTSQGGVLIDGSGDIAMTVTPQEELETMVATRLKAAVDGWKLYRIGAGLDDFKGSSIGINQNTELAIQRRVTSDLTNELLPAGSFTVQTRSLPAAAYNISPRARGGPEHRPRFPCPVKAFMAAAGIDHMHPPPGVSSGDCSDLRIVRVFFLRTHRGSLLHVQGEACGVSRKQGNRPATAANFWGGKSHKTRGEHVFPHRAL
jgi:hypothetical protein